MTNLQHGVVTHLPQYKGPQLPEASQHSLEDVGLFYGDGGSLEHLNLDCVGLAVVLYVILTITKNKSKSESKSKLTW